MAVNWNTPNSRTSEYRFLPEDITVIPELNGRYDLPDIEWLVTDIALHGQHTPVTIRNDGGNPVLVTGRSRYRAVAEINKRKLTPVPLHLRCTYKQCTEAEAMIATISENRFRNQTTALDDAHNILLLTTRFAMTEEQVVGVYFPTDDQKTNPKQFAKDLKWVKGRLLLADLTPEAAEAVRSGRVKGTAAAELARLSAELQRQVVVGGDGVVGKDKLAAAKAASLSMKKAKPSKSGKVKKIQSEGGADLNRRRNLTLAEIRAHLESVIDTGKFPGIGGEQREASDDMVEFMAFLLGEPKACQPPTPTATLDNGDDDDGVNRPGEIA